MCAAVNATGSGSVPSTAGSSNSSGNNAVLDLRFQDLEMTDLIGKGAFGEVYKARHKWLGSEIAVKIFKAIGSDNTEFKEMMAELRVLAELRHPNIVSVYGACFDPPNLALVMEYCPRTLYAAIHKDKTLEFDLPLIMKWSKDIVSGMLYLHEGKNSIHRDLKSGNLLISHSGTVKIADFGVARVCSTLGPSPMTITGTLEYMAPEVAEGVYTASVDVYSFGVILWEMCTRKKPYKDFQGHRMALMYKQHEGLRPGGMFKDAKDDQFEWTHPLPDWIPSSLSDLVVRCWKKDTAARPTFSDIYESLLQLEGSQPLKAVVPSSRFSHFMNQPMQNEPTPPGMIDVAGQGGVTFGGGAGAVTVVGGFNTVQQAAGPLKHLIDKFNQLRVLAKTGAGRYYHIRMMTLLSYYALIAALEKKTADKVLQLRYRDVGNMKIEMRDDDDLADAIQSSTDKLCLYVDLKGDLEDSDDDSDEDSDEDDSDEDDDDSADDDSDESDDGSSEEESSDDEQDNRRGRKKGSASHHRHQPKKTSPTAALRDAQTALNALQVANAARGSKSPSPGAVMGTPSKGSKPAAGVSASSSSASTTKGPVSARSRQITPPGQSSVVKRK